VLVIDALEETNLQDDNDAENLEVFVELEVSIHVRCCINSANFCTNFLELLNLIWLQLQLLHHCVLFLLDHLLAIRQVEILARLDVFIIIDFTLLPVFLLWTSRSRRRGAIGRRRAIWFLQTGSLPFWLASVYVIEGHLLRLFALHGWQDDHCDDREEKAEAKVDLQVVCGGILHGLEHLIEQSLLFTASCSPVFSARTRCADRHREIR